MHGTHITNSLALFLLSMTLGSPARAAILRVKADAPGPAHDGTTWASAYTAIQNALDAAQPGDEVWVAEGRYVEDISVPVANLTLLGGFAGTEGLAAPAGGASVITGKTAGLPVVSVPAAASGARLQGFTIRDGSSGGILCEASSVTIAQNKVLNNTARHGGGILCRNASVTIRNNLIAFNWAEEHFAGATDTPGDVGGGIAVFGGTADIRGNEIAHNICYTVAAYSASYTVTAYGGGIAVRGGVARIVNNTITGNLIQLSAYQRAADAAGAGISLIGSGLVANNILSGNYTAFTAGSGSAAHGALHIVPSADTPVRNNLFHGNTPDDAADYVGKDGNIAGDPLFRTDLPSYYLPDLRLRPGSPAIDTGDDTFVEPGETDRRGQPRRMGARVDIGAQEFVPAPPAPMSRVYVRPDGSDANAGDSWEAARATVQPALDAVAQGGEVWVAEGVYRERIVIPSGVYLVGGFAGTETAASQSAPRLHPSVLDGGQNGTVVTIPGSSLGATLDGFTVRGGGSPHGFGGWSWGGIRSEAVNVTIANSVIEDNESYVFDDNPTASGGGIDVRGGTATIRNNIIRRNRVVAIQGMGMPQFGNLVGALGGGLAITNASVIVANNLIARNDARVGGIPSNYAVLGGGLYGHNVSGKIVNNTVVANTNSLQPLFGDGSVSHGGAVYLAGTTTGLVVANNIIAFNSSGLDHPVAGAVISYNDTFGNGADFTGDPIERSDNISADPLFVDPDAGDYRLRPASPAIDAGTDAFATGDVDLDGNPRVQGLTVDMGAYEFASTGAVTMADVRVALSVAAGLQALDPAWLPRLNIVDPDTSDLNLLDAVALARKAAGLDANP